MAKNFYAVNVINWEHSENFLRRSDGLKLSHPSSLLTWVDDMKKWPEVSYGDIFNYFVLSEGVDGAAMKNYKSTEAYQYLYCGMVDCVLLHSQGDFVFLKANVHPSQSSSPNHSAWVQVSKQGSVETTGCSCIAGLGRSCSHAASILWKVRLSHTSLGTEHQWCEDPIESAPFIRDRAPMVQRTLLNLLCLLLLLLLLGTEHRWCEKCRNTN